MSRVFLGSPPYRTRCSSRVATSSCAWAARRWMEGGLGEDEMDAFEGWWRWCVVPPVRPSTCYHNSTAATGSSTTHQACARNLAPSTHPPGGARHTVGACSPHTHTGTGTGTTTTGRPRTPRTHKRLAPPHLRLRRHTGFRVRRDHRCTAAGWPGRPGLRRSSLQVKLSWTSWPRLRRSGWPGASAAKASPPWPSGQPVPERRIKSGKIRK